MDTKDLCEHTRIRLIAAAVGHQQCTKTEANIIPLPGGYRVIAIGTPAQVRELLAADTSASQEGAHAAPTDRELLDFLDQWVKENCAAGHHWFTFAFDTKKSAREQIEAEMALKTPASAERSGDHE